MIGIYVIKNLINDKKYIGQSKNIEQRFVGHRSALRHNRHANKHLQSSWNKYGECSFVFDVLEECEYEQLNEREIYYIDLYDTYNTGYNLCRGGDGNPGYKHTEDEIIKMRRIQNPKMIVQLDRDGNYIKTWIGGISHASKELKVDKRNIEICCNQIPKHKTAYGYMWFYLEDYENDNIDWDYYLDRDYDRGMKELYQINFKGKIVKKWKNASVAARELDLKSKSITNCCRPESTQKKYANYYWVYVENYSDDINWDNYCRHYNFNQRVYQLDDSKNLIASYKNINEAAIKGLGNKNLHSGINYCCNKIKNAKRCKDYIWVFEDEYNNGIDWEYYLSPNSNTKKKVKQLDLNGNLINVFESITDAQKKLNLSYNKVKKIISNKTIDNNYILEYA